MLPFERKVTEPTVTGLPLLVTVAVNVVILFGALVNDGFWEEVSTVDVEASAAVVMIRSQPVAKVHTSPAVSLEYIKRPDAVRIRAVKHRSECSRPDGSRSLVMDRPEQAKEMCHRLESVGL